MKSTATGPLVKMRKQAQELIKDFPTVEQFCWDKGIPKATMSYFLSASDRDFRVSSLEKIAKALGKTLKISME